LAAVLSIKHVAYMKRVRHILATNATKTEALRSFSAIVAVPGVANMDFASMGLVNTQFGQQLGNQAAIFRPSLEPTTWRPPLVNNRLDGLFQPPSRENRWQDLRGGMAEGIVARTAVVEAVTNIRNAQRHINNAKVRKRAIEVAMVRANVETEIARIAFNQALKRENIALESRRKRRRANTHHIFGQAVQATKKARINLYDAKDATLAIVKMMDDVNAEIKTAQAKLAAAEKAQSKADAKKAQIKADEQRNQFIKSESNGKSEKEKKDRPPAIS